ncbi:hypothetical protein Q3G72_027461 [Acer saccharum]|nr:hypothetical protein Q3G72_027461 [Acer saccharum]
MFYKSKTRHDFFPKSAFKFCLQPPGQDERYCDGCGKPVKGFVYHCKEKGWDLHPSCMNLPNKLKVDCVKFKLRDKVLKKCLWCNRRRLEGSVSRIRGWSYVSKCKKYHFHVHCGSEMMLQSWKNESNSNNDQTAPDCLALALENLELPIQGRFCGIGGGSSGDKFKRIVKMFFKVFVDAPPPEPTLDPVKLAFEKAKAYKKKSIQSAPVSKFEQNPVKDSAGIGNNSDKTVQASAKSAMEKKTKEYNNNNNNNGTVETGTSSGLKEEDKGKMLSVEKEVGKKEKLRISNIDFIGLNFEDKKTGRGVPAGLVPLADPFPEGDSPEVEIIVGDTGNFEV